MEYNKLVNEELTTIESALDEVADDVDNLDYSIAVIDALWVLSVGRSFVHQYGAKGFLCDQQAISEHADLVVVSY